MKKQKAKVEVREEDEELLKIDISDYSDEDSYQKELQQYEEKRNKKKPKEKEYYVKGQELREEILKYQQSKRENAKLNNIPYEQAYGKISENLGSMIMKIQNRLQTSPKFFLIYI